MRWIDKLERKFGRFGIPNLTFIMVACYVIGYFMEVTGSPLISMFSLSPGMIIKKGQIWRLVTWILSSPRDTEVFWFVVAVFLFYIPIGRTLERTWGSFR
ncbi:MAG: hypothetical protein KBT01_04925, partial [Clostridiales bacterium]|nr:hypothetical protein [Candidatus Blautia equi]